MTDTTAPTFALHALVAKKQQIDVQQPVYAQKIQGNISLDLQLGVDAQPYGDSGELHSCEVRAQLTAVSEGVPVYTAIVEYVAIAEITGMPEAQVAELREVALANQVLPYVRSALAGLVFATGYPTPLMPLMQASPRAARSGGAANS